MTVRRLLSVFAVCSVASATIVVAQPKNEPAPAKAPPEGATAGSGEGSAAAPNPDDAPPADMEGVNEDPDAPRTGGEKPPEVTVVPEKKKRTGYPIEEAQRPITMPANMSEVSLGIHAQVDPFNGGAPLRARYGITPKVQLGLTYLTAGFYDDGSGTALHPGKAVGLDLTVLVTNWLGIRAGVPIYVDPVAVSIALGAPMKFVFTDKFAIGALDDVVNIRVSKFAPSFYSEAFNAAAKLADENGTIQSNGSLRFAGYAVYQQSPKTAIIGRIGVDKPDFGSNEANIGGVTMFLHAGLQHTLRPFLDLGFSLGFDDLAHGGTFAPAGYLAFRI
ncbi:MAG: hypothetical protein AB7O24_12035 [Kofleriaceae bacterium]